jgi:hypothetical protein
MATIPGEPVYQTPDVLISKGERSIGIAADTNRGRLLVRGDLPEALDVIGQFIDEVGEELAVRLPGIGGLLHQVGE